MQLGISLHEIEDNTDAVEDQADEIQFGAVEFDKYTKSIKSALIFYKDSHWSSRERQREKKKDSMKLLANLRKQTFKLLKLNKILQMLKRLATSLQQDGTEVTAEEELAILKLKESIEELTEAQDGSREKELELFLLKKNLLS